MPSVIIPIEAIGPTLEVGISRPASITGQTPATRQIQWFRAIADTGCSHTSIHSSVAQRCGLNVLGKGAASTPGGQVAINIYHGDLYLRSTMNWVVPYEWPFNDRGLGEIVHYNPDFDCLLGMDILAQGLFVVNGGSKEAIFSW